MIKRIGTLLFFMVVVLSTGFAAVPAALAATDFTDIAVIDQSNTSLVGLINNVHVLGPVGQEFRASLPGLDAFELWTEDFFPGDGQGADVRVVIRKNKITGEIIGRSSIVRLPDKFGGITRFSFPGLVHLAPGNLYVVQLVVIPGDNRLVGDDWGVGSSGGPGSTYPRGNWIIGGVSTPGNDLWFVEGLASSVPQSKEYCRNGLWQVLTRADGSPYKNQGVCIQYVNKHGHVENSLPGGG